MRRPRTADVLVAAFLLVAGLAATLGDDRLASPGTAVAFTGAYAVPLAFRRVFPLTAPSISVLAVLAFGLAIEDASQPTIPLAIALAAYTIGHEVRMPRSAIAAGTLLVAFWIALLASAAPSGDLVFVVLNYGLPWLFGRTLRSRADAEEALQARAVEEERARIARELHDVVAHALSVVAVQTQAVRHRLAPEQQREAADLQAVEGVVREAMGEMRRLFGVLRGHGAVAPLAPQPGLADVDGLLAEARGAGLDVRAEIQLPAGGVPAGVGLNAYRIVQEALTNVCRHAAASAIDVRIDGAGDTLDIEIRDDGSGDGNGPPGHGLVGMRERAALYGGTLDAGSGEHGGFRVHARLPLERGRS